VATLIQSKFDDPEKPDAGSGASTPPPAGKRLQAGNSASHLVCGDGREPQVVAFEIEVVSFFVDSAEVLGVPKSVAAIYAVCFANVKPLSFADIKQRLNISQGSISQGIRVLREVGALKMVGSVERRELLSPDLELRKLAARFVETRLKKQLTAGRGRLTAMSRAIPLTDVVGREELQARLKYLQSWHDKGRALVPIVKTFLRLA
jgi:DNA-binding transcriptional regulator GbsR (MarR family)